eukprot:TRINITY_DN8947_c1_g1_i1.p1 TRINITY_DN8947_c1_g1~~TRINITY_DN8947_c1_g1_i1.p1  ORF type:complete len:305 (-),score=110.94 TRINITY_DN8947_c1_g1_i1:552-1466(-)
MSSTDPAIIHIEGMEAPLDAADGKDKKKRKEKASAKGSAQGNKKDGKGKGKWEAYSGPEGSGNGYRLNVKNLSNETNSAEALRRLFEPFGIVADAQVKAREDGSSRGFGFVVLGNQDEAEKAIEALDGKPIGGKSLSVAPAVRRQPAEAELAQKGKGKGKSKAGGPKADEFDPAALNALQAMQIQQQFYLQMLQATQLQAMQAINPELGSPYSGLGGISPFLPNAATMAAAAAIQSYNFGTLKSSSVKNGYGFIECAETKALYGRDVYVDIRLLPSGAKPGASLKFMVDVNPKGHPNATLVEFA